jgi:hypothetical protein
MPKPEQPPILVTLDMDMIVLEMMTLKLAISLSTALFVQLQLVETGGTC